MSSLLHHHRNISQDSWGSIGYRNQYEQQSDGPPTRSERESSASSWFTGGLPTPPVGKSMNVASYVPQPAHSQHAKYSQPSSTADNYSMVQHTSYPLPVQPQYPQAANMTGYAGIAMPVDTRPQQHEIASHLQIPESVNKSKGSLAEFAAEIASLFWFESGDTLKNAENLAVDAPTDRGLVPDAVPSIGFRKWVTTILSTTQVGKNVILLGLLFIYRLKQFNPGVSGKRGSEFRLLTIALMLGNKFLDDNTYTNKTWAEVSGISVTEIHIMEVEFLSNMRYDLYVSAEEWKDWKAKLGRLGSFYEKASRFDSRSTPAPVTPTVPTVPHKLPSPPSTHSASSIFTNGNGSYMGLPNPMLNAPQLRGSPSRSQRYGSADIIDQRKRSLDMGSDLPPAKRMHYSSPQYQNVDRHRTPSTYPPVIMTGSMSVPPALDAGSMASSNGDVPRLPMPRLPVSTAAMNNGQLAPLNLPVSRAMAQVYPPTSTAAWSNPLTPGSQQGLYQQPIPSLGDHSRSQSAVNSNRTSPNGYTTITPILPGLSPSYFLTNRQSPYRPVRHVNTLLIPPPSAALQNQARTVSHEQMHYQPLSKVNFERRSGPVPYHQPEGWQQSNANTPLTQQYPYRY